MTTFNGSGAFQTPEFTILPNAIQWRVRFTCATGTLRINSNPPPRRPGPVVDATCPKEDTGYSIVTGPVRMSIEATGTWKAVVDQQVDTPLDEPLLPGMTPDRVIAQGSFYKVEVRGEGTAKLYRLPDGKRILRFENFQTGENTDLFVWLSEVAKPANSAEAVGSPHVEISNLKSTIGTQNYEIPASVPDREDQEHRDLVPAGADRLRRRRARRRYAARYAAVTRAGRHSGVVQRRGGTRVTGTRKETRRAAGG